MTQKYSIGGAAGEKKSSAKKKNEFVAKGPKRLRGKKRLRKTSPHRGKRGAFQPRKKGTSKMKKSPKRKTNRIQESHTVGGRKKIV